MERRSRDRYIPRQYERANPIYEVYPYRIRDISIAGCALECDAPVRIEGGPQGFEIPLHYRATIFKAGVRVVWQAEQTDAEGNTCFVYGLHFREMDEENRLALHAYVDHVRQDMALSRLETAWDRVKQVQERLGSLTRYDEIDTCSRRELDRCVDVVRQDMAATSLDQAWDTLHDIQRKLATLVACEERKGTTYLN